MAQSDRSWTIAPTLLWFCGCLVAGLLYFDGDVQAIADRVTTKRDEAPAGGPIVAGKPAGGDSQAKPDDDEKPAPLPEADRGDRSRVGALEDVCLDGTPDQCKRWSMDGFYRAVAESKQDKLGRAVRVSWYGDSVIATDAIPARLRERMQKELGDGGPGFVYIDPPHRFCAHQGVTRTKEGEWRTHAISTQPTADGLYGVGGSSTETHSGSATVKLVGGRKATNVELYYVAQPKGGTATVTADGTEIVKAETAADAKVAGHATGTSPGARKFQITTKGKVRLYGIDIENASGAVVDNFGIVSVHAKNFAARNLDDFTADLGHRSADLMLVMIGANEAQWLSPSERAMKEYQRHFEKAIAPLRKGRPDGACLVVSPLDQAEAKDAGYVSRPVMPRLVEAQRRAAKAVGCAFFSTYDWMGGKGSAAKWFKKNLVSTDFQHLSTAGAKKLSDGVFETLMQGYQRYGE
ncbi:MAG: GDSL-type esterase/lipase family protein [Myxococcota bacterium]|nr:GDSL-type esterase/lipase family protein [Myxococcota bacterium]